MSDDNLMAVQIRQIFNGAGECLSSENGEHFFVVEDSKSKSIIVKELADLTSGFEIGNPNQKDIYLLAIDSCIFTSADEGRCDCVLFDDRIFCFVELKLDVSRRKQATKKLNEARGQLGKTILYFQRIFAENHNDFLGLKLEAYAVMREHIYPRDRAGRKEVFVKFFDEYKVQLFEEMKKVFGDNANLAGK